MVVEKTPCRSAHPAASKDDKEEKMMTEKLKGVFAFGTILLFTVSLILDLTEFGRGVFFGWAVTFLILHVASVFPLPKTAKRRKDESNRD